MNDENIMPLQPIKDARFVQNRIVSLLLDSSTYDLNDIAMMDFTDQERSQLASLIGYSLSGFAELDYVDDETYAAAEAISEKRYSEDRARASALRGQLNDARKGVKAAAVALFRIHEDDLSE